MNYLGIDIGSSGCKAVAYDRGGEPLAHAFRDYNVIHTNDGGAELDSEEVIRKCFEVIKECAGQVEPNTIVGMGISSQGEAFTAISDRGEILCNAMISSDTRSGTLVESWTGEFGKEKLYQITGHTAHPMFTLFKLLWLKQNRPDIWGRARKFYCFEDLLQYRLGLDPAIAYPLAGRTMMFDVRKHVWSGDILRSIGVNPGQLARPLPSGTVAGTVDSGIAYELGLAEKAFVVTGGHDQACGALGAGITKAGMAMYATGTVDCITPAFANPVFTEELFNNNLCTYDHSVEGMYVTVAFSLTGGNILKWFRDEFGHREVAEAERLGEDAYQLLLNQMGRSPSSLLVLPYFTPSGTPYFDLETRGAILGLRLSTNRGEFIRGLLEGVAFEMRLNMEILAGSGCEIDEMRVIGGGARSDTWTQLKADVTGKKITTLNITEAGCTGVAMLACAAHRGEAVGELANKWISPRSVIKPSPGNISWYNKRFEVYKKLYHSIRELGI